ncbi:hypothetical protein P389DRAFT_32306 [Cystobasidium minutum MCA 4210]|uniref:uncharacterized protein n=1 Tax=Cystobasidium minutum MCA 4210 TaxID=1397322 RepID=UPI0034CE590B|eukprot:jgi/Rhomi1/32306/CE32305_354
MANKALPIQQAGNAQGMMSSATTAAQQTRYPNNNTAQQQPQQPFKMLPNNTHIGAESGNETFAFAGEAPAYHSSASAENDSAPSLARTGTGSSSSGFSAQSDGGLAVTADELPPKQTKEQVMSRLSQLLSTYRSQPQTPTALQDPPRQLLLHSPVLQVVNSNTVKDRYLFLFNDILVIAKPIIEEDASGEPILPTLSSKFAVKSIVELPKLKLTAQSGDGGEDPVQKRKHPLLLTFVDRFSNDPRKAVSALIAKAGLSNDATTIANLLFRNPELNRSQLGAYLAHKDQKPILKAYCDRFRLAGIRIEDALRVFIGSLRLPNDYTAAEYMLSVFASQWLANNPGTGMTNDGVFATKLVLSMMELNDALHSGIDDEATAAGNLFSFPNSAITVDDFIAAFRLKDPHGALPDEHLTRIYLSIRKDRLQQAADNAVVSGIPEIEVITHPSKLPNRLTYRTASENISLTIPKIDPKFAIKLVGQDLRFEPPVLTFARSRTATFRVMPTALGSKAMLFIRLGPNAHLYRNLPINKTFSVERAFMNHTFQIAFVNHLGVKRKYLFSLSNAETKYNWVDTLRTRIENSPVEQPDVPRPARLSDAVSLQVLRDALIAPDEPAPVLANKVPLHGGRPGFTTPPNSRGKSAANGGGVGTLQRSSSFSKTYAHGLGKAESDLTEQRRPSVTNTSLLAPLSMRRGSRDDEKSVQQQQQQQQHYKTGHEIVTAVRQNSLLPLVLGFVGAGVEGIDAFPRKPIHPQTTQVHTTPAQARGTGRFNDL